MSEEKHFSKNLIDKASHWQRKLRSFSYFFARRLAIEKKITTATLPLLTQPQAFGDEISVFKNSTQALNYWKNKHLQHWQFLATFSVSQTDSPEYGFYFQFFQRHTQTDFVGIVPLYFFKPQIATAHFCLIDLKQANKKLKYQFWQKSSLNPRTFHFLAENGFKMALDGWSCSFDHANQTFSIQAHTQHFKGNFSIKLAAPPAQVMLHGNEGYTQQHQQEDNISYFASYPQAFLAGSILNNQKEEQINGKVWINHEKISAQLKPHFNRLFVNLNAQQSLLIHFNEDYSYASFSDQTDSRRSRSLISSEIKIENLEFFRSPKTGNRYLIKFLVTIEVLNIKILVQALDKEQEADALLTSMSAFWLGLVQVKLIDDSKPNIPAVTGFFMSLTSDQRPSAKMLNFLIYS